MPPKARFTREKIEEAAYQIAREKGIQAVAAREVARMMDMTVTPIFSYFTGMEELRATVRERVCREFTQFLRGSLDYYPAFQEFGLRWMGYAAENPNLYMLLVNSGEDITSVDDLLGLIGNIVDPIVQEISGIFAISRENAWNLLRHMVIYANGLAGLLLREDCTMTREELSGLTSEICLSLAVRARLLDGSATAESARDLLSVGNIQPKRKGRMPE